MFCSVQCSMFMVKRNIFRVLIGYSILNHVGYLMFSNDNVSKNVNLKSFTMFSCFNEYLGSCRLCHQIPSSLSVAGCCWYCCCWWWVVAVWWWFSFSITIYKRFKYCFEFKYGIQGLILQLNSYYEEGGWEVKVSHCSQGLI